MDVPFIKTSRTERDPSINDKLREKFEENGLDIQVNQEALRSSNYDNTRFLVYELGCEYCRSWLDVIAKINHELDRTSTTIELIDIEQKHPIITNTSLVEKISGPPVLYIDGILVKGITTSGFGRGFLKGFLEEELMVE